MYSRCFCWFPGPLAPSASRSASTARRPRVIARFLATTAARSPRLTASMRQITSSDLVRDTSFLTGTGKVVAPSTRFTAISSYRIFIRMIELPEEILRQNTALAGTHGEGNKTRKHRSWNWKWQGILERREIIHLQVFFHLFQERLDTSFQLFGTKSRIVFRIGIPWSW